MIARGGALALALALISGSMAACGEREDAMANGQICADFSKTDVGKSSAPADAAAPVDTCVLRWAYSLAGARDSADVVANAAVGACAAALDHWNLTAGDPASSDSGGTPPDATSLVSGQSTNAMSEHAAFAQRQALLYVIEARAGRCKPPPAKNGVPAGA